MSDARCRFGIVMPAYNEESRLARAVESILTQSSPNFRLVVVNDGSTDRTGEIADSFAGIDARVSVIHPGKVGKVAAFNEGVRSLRADWYYFMGADDVLPDDAIEQWLQAVEDIDPETHAAACARLRMASDDPKYDGLILPKGGKVMNWSGPVTLLSYGMMQVVVPIPEHYPNEDTWWTLCIEAFATKMRRIEAIVVIYSVHSGNSISRSSPYTEFSRKYNARMKAVDEFLSRYEECLTLEQKNRLSARSRLESARFEHGAFAVSLCRGVGIKEKLRALALSGPGPYALKLRLDRWILGH